MVRSIKSVRCMLVAGSQTETQTMERGTDFELLEMVMLDNTRAKSPDRHVAIAQPPEVATHAHSELSVVVNAPSAQQTFDLLTAAGSFGGGNLRVESKNACVHCFVPAHEQRVKLVAEYTPAALTVGASEQLSPASLPSSARRGSGALLGVPGERAMTPAMSFRPVTESESTLGSTIGGLLSTGLATESLALPVQFGDKTAVLMVQLSHHCADGGCNLVLSVDVSGDRLAMSEEPHERAADVSYAPLSRLEVLRTHVSRNREVGRPPSALALSAALGPALGSRPPSALALGAALGSRPPSALGLRVPRRVTNKAVQSENLKDIGLKPSPEFELLSYTEQGRKNVLIMTYLVKVRCVFAVLF